MKASQHCAACGQALPVFGGVVAEAGMVSFNGLSVRLSKLHFEILQLLLAKKGGAVTQETLLDQIYQLKRASPDINVMRVAILKLRRALQPLGLVIDTVWGFGYRLRIPVAADV